MAFGNGHLARAVLRATQGDAQIVTTLHYDLAGNVAQVPPSLQALADRLRDDLLAKFAACFIPSWIVQPIEVFDEKDPVNPLALRDSASAGAALAGTRLAPPSGEVIPIQMCCMATLRTQHIGRSFRGRMFTPPLWSDAQIDGGVATGAQFANFQALVDAIPLQPDLVTGTIQGTANLCIYSRTRRALNAANYAEHVTSITLANTVRWLRSRAV